MKEIHGIDVKDERLKAIQHLTLYAEWDEFLAWLQDVARTIERTSARKPIDVHDNCGRSGQLFMIDRLIGLRKLTGDKISGITSAEKKE